MVMKRKHVPEPPKIYVAIPTSGKDGQMRLSGIFRYLGGNRTWDLRLVRSRLEFNHKTIEEAVKDGMDGFIIAVPFCGEEISFLADTGLPVVVMTDAEKLAVRGGRIFPPGKNAIWQIALAPARTCRRVSSGKRRS